MFDKNTSGEGYDDVVLTVSSNVDNEISGLKIGSTTVNAANYDVDDLELTIKKEYLATLAEGVKAFSVVLAKGPAVAAAVTVVDTTA